MKGERFLNKPNAVLIAEKPSQASSYAAAFKVTHRTKEYIELAPCSTFPKGAIIVWCFGHLLTLKEPHEYEGKEHLKNWAYHDLPITFEHPELKVQEDVKEHYLKIKKLVRECILGNLNDHVVWLCCDPDREGSAIGWNFVNSIFAQHELNRICFKRLFIKSYEKDEIFKNFQRPFPIEQDKLFATEAYTRAVADFVVGINGSRLYTILINNSIRLQNQSQHLPPVLMKNQLMRVGRVQSTTLYLVYERQLEIENFVPKDFYELYAEFQAKNGTYRGKADVKEEELSRVQEFLSKHQLVEGMESVGYVKSIHKEQKRESSPMLHSLTTLQTKANKKWRMSPKIVLDTVQSLYEKHKLLTYPRTDCQFITEAEFEYLRANVDQYKSVLGVEFTNRYMEPRNRYVRTSAVQEHYAIIPTKKIPSPEQLQSLTENERNIYLEVLRTTVAMFHADYVYEKTTLITDLNGIEFKTTGKIELSRGFKELWPNEEMLSKGRGHDEQEDQPIPLLSQYEQCKGSPQIKSGVTKPPRPYTEGELIRVMETCGSKVEDREDARILKEVSGIGTVATRADIIENLKATKYIEVVNDRIQITEKGRLLCIALKGTLLASPVMTAKWEAYLRKIGEGKASPERFLHAIDQFVAKLIQDAPVRVASREVQEQIARFIEYENARNHFGQCPKCHKGMIVYKKSFYGCTEYQNGCDFQLWPTIRQKKLTEKQIRTLIERGKTGVLKGFVSKQGKPYNARVLLDEECRVIIEPVF